MKLTSAASSPIARRALQRRPDIALSEFGFGGAPLGELFTRVSESDAQATLARAWESGVRYFDTAPFYGHGKSEHRIGRFLREKEHQPFVLSSKIGRVFKASTDLDFDPSPWTGGLPFEFTFDYGYDGVMRSWEDSLQRLGLSCIDILYVHDLDPYFQPGDALERHRADLAKSGWKALDDLRSSGAIGAVGAGINCLGMIPWFLEHCDPDVFLVAMPYTLLDQSVLTEEFPACASRDVSIVIGAVFASGILITGSNGKGRYAYQDAPATILEKTRRIEAVCARYDVPLAAGALQFPLAHPLVASVIPGAQSPDHIDQNLASANQPIPSAFWRDLVQEGLIERYGA